MSFHEIGVALVFLTTVLLWLFRDPRFIPGWADQIMGAKNGDATAAMIGVLLMFIIPRDLSFITGSKFLQISM
jgi:sodium-dependent dicarboxylate transporter 2/3/5